MSRPLRIEYEDAFCYIMNSGRRREKIFFCDNDYYCFLGALEEAVKLKYMHIV